MSIPGRKVFLIGPGYIGREVIDCLLESEDHVTALVRRESAGKELEKDGISFVLGSLEDAEIITKQTAASDIVIHTATADDLGSVNAVISGIDQRASENKHTIYIHTSGCSFLSDDINGEYKSDMVYSDKSPEDMDARPDSASHRSIDLAIIRARQRLGVKAKLFIMLPPLIYGATRHQRLSIQITTMARFALKHKYAGYVGKGKSAWGLVHVADLARGYRTMLDWLVTSPPETALSHPYFFCENGMEITWGEAASLIGEELHAIGRIPDSTPREVPRELWGDLFGEYSIVVIGANARNRADRLRELGWKPKHVDARAAFKTEELPLLLGEVGDFHGYARAAASGGS